MDRILIRGGRVLSGSIPISGAKNAALTLMPCALLTDEPLTLRNLPRLADIDGFQHLMNQFGVTTVIQGTRPEDFGRVMSMEATRIIAIRHGETAWNAEHRVQGQLDVPLSAVGQKFTDSKYDVVVLRIWIRNTRR